MFTDNKVSNNYFTRTVNNSIYHYINNEIIKTENIKSNFIKKTSKDKNIMNKFIITLDIETRNMNNVLEPYLICFYDGNKKHSFFLSDYNSVNDMILDCFKNLLIPKYNNKIIYIHNLSLFDGIFLLNPLSDFIKSYKELNIIKKDNNLILLQYNNEDNFKIKFMDSLLLLPLSLKALAKTFNKENDQKDIFPYSFVDTTDLNYVGQVPDFKYFNNITIQDYNDYCSRFNNNWSLREESIKYCIQDCVSLYMLYLILIILFINIFILIFINILLLVH